VKATAKNRIDHILKAAGLRRTGPRMAILEALLNARKPLTHAHIAKKLGPAAPDKVTIYRTLETFVHTGIIHRAFLRKRAWHFELAHNCTDTQCHPHFTCNDCGTTHCLTRMTLPLASGQPRGFIIHRQRIQLDGLCPECS